MTSFATLADYQEHVDLITDGATALRIEAALDAACDLIRDYLCQQIDVVTNDVITIYGTGTRALLLPELPVTAVDSITLDGTAITDYTLDTYGLLWRDSPGWWSKGDKYVVTYDHGYATVPSIYKRVACKLAHLARSTAPAGVRSESTGPFSVTYVDVDRIKGRLSEEEALLSVLDRRVVKRIPVP